MPEAKPSLSLVNARLKADRVGVSVQVRGDRLALVATLPPKSESTKDRPYQQRISLGIYASVAGLKQAERLARLLGIELAEQAFSWATWSKISEDSEETVTAGQWVERFRATLNISEESWRYRFLHAGGFKHLHLDQPLTPEALLEVVFKQKPDTATRRSYCDALQRLAKLAEIPVDLKVHAGSYSEKAVTPKDIPSDDQIIEQIEKVPNPGWRYCFGLMATYGLRPHEVFFTELENLEGVITARVTEGKTGGRYPVFPVPADWAAKWQAQLPRCASNKAHSHRRLGSMSGATWRRYHPDLPWTLYDLRHAYAIRCHLYAVPVAVAAQWMGHSPEIHLRTYQRWISEKHHLETYRRLFMSPKT